ncbi:MAG: long-chain fatty acid--CoA ligase [Nitriliruptor sp.]|nr:MAG: long-chain fatty acid--CoA ligase [Nitriliruptor sp.]
MSATLTATTDELVQRIHRQSLPGRLIHLAHDRGDDPALREKRLGVWDERTWAGYRDEVLAAAIAMLDAGVRHGDHVAILSENREEWVFADLAAQSIGARSVGVYPTNPEPEVAYILSHSQSVLVVCEDQEQVDKVVAIRDQTPMVRRVVVIDPRGTWAYADDRLIGWEEFVGAGRAQLADRAGEVLERIAAIDPDEPAMIVYTSGTTGPPKGAMLSSRNVTASADAGVEAFGYSDREQVLSYLPLCHVAEKIFTLYLPLATGAVVHFGESIDTVADDLREVSPTVFVGVPRIWEKMHSSVLVKMGDSSRLKRALLRVAVGQGQRLSAKKQAGKRWNPLDHLVWKVFDLLVFRALQERLGLRRCWFPVSGAAPVAPELLRWFHGIGVPIAEGYGQTECAGVSHANPPDAVKIGTVGPAIPSVECVLGPGDEVLVRGPQVFVGYLHNEEATAETVDVDGWLHTGDVGAIDEDGYLSITGRIKDIIITAGGKNLSPEQIENQMKTSPYIKECVAIGDGRKFISALIQIDADNVGDWASRKGIAYTSFQDLAAKDEVVQLVDGEVRRCNEGLARVEQVRAFRLLPKELHQDDEELTATQKVRRTAFYDRYAGLIQEMY